MTFTTDLAKPLDVYTPFEIPDPRANGQTMTVYAIDPAALASINELDTNSISYKRSFNGFDVTLWRRLGRWGGGCGGMSSGRSTPAPICMTRPPASTLTRRLPSGGFVSGGMSTGRTISTECDVTSPNQSRFCDERGFEVPFRTTFKMSGNYPLPYGFRVSGVLQSIAGDASVYTYVVTAAYFASVTGANLGQPSVNMRLTEPGSRYLDRVNQLDLTFAKSFGVGRVRVSPEVSLFNAYNANPVLSEATAYPRVGTPLSILDGRLIRFSAQMRF